MYDALHVQYTGITIISGNKKKTTALVGNNSNSMSASSQSSRLVFKCVYIISLVFSNLLKRCKLFLCSHSEAIALTHQRRAQVEKELRTENEALRQMIASTVTVLCDILADTGGLDKTFCAMRRAFQV